MLMIVMRIAMVVMMMIIITMVAMMMIYFVKINFLYKINKICHLTL